MAQFLGRDVDQHVFAARIVLRNPLGEVAHSRGEFAVRPAELFEEKAGQHRVRLRHAHCVHEPLVVHKHGFTSWSLRTGVKEMQVPAPARRTSRSTNRCSVGSDREYQSTSNLETKSNFTFLLDSELE